MASASTVSTARSRAGIACARRARASSIRRSVPVKSGTAAASDCCCYKYVTTYKCVICYETRCEPYTKTYTYYDQCGKPYCVTKTCYHDVQVAVKKYVPCVEKVACY